MAHVEQHIVDNFKEVCAVNDQKALQFLRHCDGNLESAVQLFFTTGGNLENSNEGEQNVQNADNELRRRNVDGGFSTPISTSVSRPPARPVMGWMEWILTIIRTVTIRFPMSLIWDIFAFIGQLLWGSSRPAVTDPIGDVNRFIENYHSHILPAQATPLPFLPTSFSEAVRQAKTDIKMLIVYLHGPDDESTRFVRETLHDPAMVSFIDQNELMVWGCGVDQPEGKHAAFSLRARGYPFIGLMVNRDNRSVLAVKMDRFITSENLLTNLRFTVVEMNAQMNAQRLEKAQREADAALRAQQNKEYEESRRRDRERAEQRQREEQEKRVAEEAVRKKEQIKLDRIERIKSHRATVVPCMVGSTRVQVRFPSGDKTVLQFDPNSPVTTVFDSIIAQTACPDYFSVATTFPRKVLSVAPSWYVDLTNSNADDGGTAISVEPADGVTVQEAGIQNGTTLMVQDLDA